MIAKFNSKTHTQNMFFVFLNRFVCKKSKMIEIRVSKNAKFDAYFESVEKVSKRQMRKKLSAKK
jgi:hypothetical protein